MEYEFCYGFWGLHPNILAHGEKAFEEVAAQFHVSCSKLNDIEDEAKDMVLEALVCAHSRGSNPFRDHKEFLLENLINSYKLDCLIDYICATQDLNKEDFNHDAYNDGALLNVYYKGEVIA